MKSLRERLFVITAAVVLSIFLISTVRFRDGSGSIPSIPSQLFQGGNTDATATFEKPNPSHDVHQEEAASERPIGPKPQEQNTPDHGAPKKLAPGECLPEIQALRKAELGLTSTVRYTRRCVKPIWGHSDRDVVTEVSESLLTETTLVNLHSCTHIESVPCDRLELHVPYAYPTKKYPNIILGIASKYERINDALPAFAHALANSSVRLIGVVVDADKWENNLDALQEQYKTWNVDATFLAPRMKKKMVGDPRDQIPVEHHHFMLIRDLMDASTPETQWLGVLDDDTFFPSLYSLDQELAKYDAKKPWWLGSLSDSFDSVRNWGFMAFGGAGSFLSMPLARAIEPLLEECIKEATVQTGDGILRDCVYGHTRTHLTLMRDLYQLDIRGDASGFFESGPRPLSLHHWKSWFNEPIPKMAAVTGLCGDCFLQRWQFGNDTLFVNGYSITTYPHTLFGVDLGRMEGTWENPGRDYDFSYGPLRPKLGPAEKKGYRLLEAEVTTGGDFRQLYVHKGNKDAGETDEVVELLWEGYKAV